MALVAHAIPTEYALRIFYHGENWNAAKNFSAMSQQQVYVRSTATKPEVVDSTKAATTSPRGGLSRSGSTTSTSSSSGRQPPAPPARHPSTVISSNAGGLSGCSATRRSHGTTQRTWGNAYELSQDIRERQLEALARRYGGSTKASSAAAVIQHAYRRHCMAKNFAKLRHAADERWRFHQQNGGTISRPLSDFTRSKTMWTEVRSVGFGFDTASTKLNCDDDNDDDFEAALSSVEASAEFDVMSHSFSADNMLTLTRRSHHHHHSGCRHTTKSGASADHDQSSTSSSRRQRRQVAFSEESNSVVVVETSGSQVAGDPQASTAPYFSSGDSSDEGGSDRASPVLGVDPTSADFETALEADVAADDDSFDSTDEDDDAGDFQSTVYSPQFNAVSTPSPVRRAAHHLQSLQIHQHGSEMYVGGTEVKLRRKKVDAIPADEAAIMGLWQWKNSTASSSSDGDHSHCLSDTAVENCELFVTAADYPTLMASHGDEDISTLRHGTLSRTSDREISMSPETSIHVGQLSSPPPINALQSRMTERLRKRTYRIGLNLFNKKPENGICYLVDHQFLDDRPSSVARFLITRKGLSKQMIGEYLGNLQRPFNMEVLSCFTEQIDLTGLQVDVALRKFQSYFRMPGEAQKIERLMEAFASRYCRCNLEDVRRFESSDTIFLLAFAVIMLNTDLHNSSIKPERKMKLTDFIKNLRGIDGGSDIVPELLTGIYERVRDCEFKPGTDHVTQVMRIEQMIVGKKLQLAVPCRRLVCYCRLCEIVDINKREKLTRHQREIFLFNDMLLVTKIINKKKAAAYSFRQSFPLCGMTVFLIDTPHYPHGIRLATSVDDKVLITLNARNETDRNKFVNDLKEAILEMNEMETMRIDEELKKQKVPPNPAKTNRYSKDSGVVDIELLKLDAGGHRLSAPECERLKKSTLSNSLIDISEGSRRASGGSLDSGMASAESGSTHSCCQHDTVGGVGCKLPHYLKTLQPPPLSSGPSLSSTATSKKVAEQKVV